MADFMWVAAAMPEVRKELVGRSMPMLFSFSLNNVGEL